MKLKVVKVMRNSDGESGIEHYFEIGTDVLLVQDYTNHPLFGSDDELKRCYGYSEDAGYEIIQTIPEDYIAFVEEREYPEVYVKNEFIEKAYPGEEDLLKPFALIDQVKSPEYADEFIESASEWYEEHGLESPEIPEDVSILVGIDEGNRYYFFEIYDKYIKEEE